MVTRTQPFNRAEFRQGLQYGQAKEDFRDLSPKCTKCHLHHNGPCTQKCHKCNKVGHFARDCRGTGNTNVANTQKGNGAAPKENGCFKCGAPGHFKRDCPKLKNTDGGNGNAQGGVYAFGNVLFGKISAKKEEDKWKDNKIKERTNRTVFLKYFIGGLARIQYLIRDDFFGKGEFGFHTVRVREEFEDGIHELEVVLCANLALHEREAKTLWSIADASLKSFMRLRRWLELLSDYDCGHSFSPARQRNADALSKPETINLKDKQMLAYASEGLPKERLELTPIEL
ncbi:putative reverse transcriptase domain-containing protein [Tanacetum coccineum]